MSSRTCRIGSEKSNGDPAAYVDEYNVHQILKECIYKVDKLLLGLSTKNIRLINIKKNKLTTLIRLNPNKLLWNGNKLNANTGCNIRIGSE